MLRTKLILGVAPLVSAPGCVDTGHLVCAVQRIAPGRSAGVTIVVRARNAGRYNNEASASASEPDPLLINSVLTSTLVRR